jgi:hypothetical protein
MANYHIGEKEFLALKASPASGPVDEGSSAGGQRVQTFPHHLALAISGQAGLQTIGPRAACLETTQFATFQVTS